MRYARYRDLGMLTGSGAIEAGCKQIIQSLASAAISDRQKFRLYMCEDQVDLADLDVRWTRVLEGTSSLREAMRTDLGLPGSDAENGAQPRGD